MPDQSLVLTKDLSSPKHACKDSMAALKTA